MRRLRAVPVQRMHLYLMLALTFTTGINDAVGYLGLDKVFTGNMTGNVVVLGMALAGGSGLPVLGPALALLGYLAGAACGGRAMRYAGTGWTRPVTAALGAVAAIMLVLGAVLLLVDDPAHGVMVAVTTCAAVAMGIQAATARHVAVADITTVVVTSTLTGLAADPFRGEHRSRAARRFGAVALILLGAVVGALLIKAELGLGLVVAGVVIAAVTTLGHLSRPVDGV
ncbi:MAG TPA: YoaK family protein [Nocardioides sp.]|nr:YoaK family protein [Nocardioides sp.]